MDGSPLSVISEARDKRASGAGMRIPVPHFQKTRESQGVDVPKIEDNYQISDAMPETFNQAIWVDERPVANRTAADAQKVVDVIRQFGSKFSVGTPCALPDAIQGGSAPALPMDLIVASGHDAVKLFYAVDVTMQTTIGIKTVVMEIGQAIDIFDGPQESYLGRLSRFIEVVDGPGGPATMELLTGIDPIVEGMEAVAKKLLAPFKK